MTSDQWKEIPFIVITSNLEFISTCRKEKHSPIPQKYCDVAGATHTNLDVLHKSHLGNWENVDVDRNADSWTGFKKFTFLNSKHQKEYMWSGKRLAKVQATAMSVARNLVWHVKNSSEKRRSKNGPMTDGLEKGDRKRERITHNVLVRESECEPLNHVVRFGCGFRGDVKHSDVSWTQTSHKTCEQHTVPRAINTWPHMPFFICARGSRCLRTVAVVFRESRNSCHIIHVSPHLA